MLYSKKEDHVLINEYISGDEKAFEELLMRHKDRVHLFIMMKLKDADLTEDIFQETFIKVINTLKKGNYNEEGKFLPWALRIAHNLIIDYFRKANRVRFVSETTYKDSDFNIFDVLSDQSLNIEQVIVKDELENQMVDLVRFLPKTQRDVLEMRIFQELSFQDIADQEGVSINTALGRMRYALMNMRKLIAEHQIMVEV
jgi:RNA polymerase sigma-70 factor, ECF subfamily